mmetsp:Transcript_3477/g.6182  ORF Transcript_3477/g.6182 Transcript_3477/m.6182 type:complete len:350 (-) Transcript_3477:403-1452(-)
MPLAPWNRWERPTGRTSPPAKSAPPIAYVAAMAMPTACLSDVRSTLAADRSKHRHPTIHMHRGAGQVARFRARQEKGRGGDLVGRPHAPGGNLHQNLLFLVIGQLVRHRRFDEARRDAIDRDAPARDFVGQGFRHAHHARLGGRVIGLSGVTRGAYHAGNIDDPAPTGLHHATQRAATEPHGRGQVDLQHARPLLVGHAHEKVVAGDAGVVHQHVEAAHCRDRLLGQGVDRLRVAQVAGQDMGALTKVGSQRLQRLDPRARKAHGRARGVQLPRNRRTDPARRAGYQRVFSCQVKHFHPYFFSSVASLMRPARFGKHAVILRPRCLPSAHALPRPSARHRRSRTSTRSR